MAKQCVLPTTHDAWQAAQPARQVDASPSSAVPLLRIAVLAVGLLLLTRDVGRLFVAHHEANSAEYSMFARNHIEYGLGYTKLYCTWGDTQPPPVVPDRYLNHPPLIAVWTALPMLVFGDHEWAARLVPIAATLGGAWIIMVMLTRLQTPALGLLTGLFYVMLPGTGFFGRMADHIPVAQFFNLLMLHGYLQWSGWYGAEWRPRVGTIQYCIGAVLGIGTAWNAVILAGLIWLWHAARTRFRRGSRSVLLGVTLVPSAALAAVLLHIVAGCGWKADLLGPLFVSRTKGGNQALVPWLAALWMYLLELVSFPGVVAAVAYLSLIGVGAWLRARAASWQPACPRWRAVAPILLTLLHAITFVAIFKNQSFYHDYWQYPALPFFAAALASVVLAAYSMLAAWSARLARVAGLLLVLAPMPFFARGRDALYEWTAYPPEISTALKQLSEFVPPYAAVMTSLPLEENAEEFGSYTNRWISPTLAYYAHRRLIHTVQWEEIIANRPGSAVYLLNIESADLESLAWKLADAYEYEWLGPRQALFLLDHPKAK